MRARVSWSARGRGVVTGGLACAGLVAAGLGLTVPVAATAATTHVGADVATTHVSADATPSAPHVDPYVGPHAGLYAQPAVESLVYIDESVSEVPNAVAVANDGTIAASLFDARAIALVKGPGTVVTVSLGCSPADVAIHPDATLAWAVCPGDPHLYVIDVASGGVTVASLDLRQADDVVYLPGPDRLVIADFEGGIVVATSAPGYQVIKRIPTPDSRPTVLAVLDDGSRGYAVTDSGRLLAVDLARGTVADLRGQGPGVVLSSIALSRSGTAIYATAYGLTDTDPALLVRLDPVSGDVIQRVPLAFTTPGSTSMAVAAGHRSLSVATGLSMDIDGQSTGTFDVALNEQGVMGDLSALMPVSYLASDVGRSGDGTRVAFGITNSRAAGVRVADPPFPTSITIKGVLRKGKLSLGGATVGLQPGTPLTVHVKDATKKKAPFVVQRVKATVDARGVFSWNGKASVKRVKVFVAAPKSSSPTITITSQ